MPPAKVVSTLLNESVRKTPNARNTADIATVTQNTIPNCSARPASFPSF